jgi:hypothetical protein
VIVAIPYNAHAVIQNLTPLLLPSSAAMDLRWCGSVWCLPPSTTSKQAENIIIHKQKGSFDLAIWNHEVRLPLLAWKYAQT